MSLWVIRFLYRHRLEIACAITALAALRKTAQQPLCVGFGISTPEQASQIAQIADGVIVGSRLIQLMEQEDGFTSLTRLVRDLRDAIDKLP